MTNVTIRANNPYSAPEGKSTQTWSTKSHNAATPLIIPTWRSRINGGAASSRSLLIERVPFLVATLKVTKHVVVKLNIY